MRDWGKHKQMPKSGLFGIRLHSKWGMRWLPKWVSQFPKSSYFAPTSYYQKLAVSKKKKNILYILSTPDYSSPGQNIRPYQCDCEHIFLWSTDSKQIAFGCSPNIRHINECCLLPWAMHPHQHSLIFTRLVRHSQTDVDATLGIFLLPTKVI